MSLPPIDVRAALSGFATIGAVADEFRELVAKQAPDLLDRLPPKRPPAKSVRRKRPASKATGSR